MEHMLNIYYIIIIVYIANITKLFGHPSYEYSCQYTFYPEDGSISATVGDPPDCSWQFTAHESETFQLTFYSFDVEKYHGNCDENYVAVRDGPELLKHCGNIQTPYSIKTSGNNIGILYTKKQGVNFVFFAKLTRVIKSQFTSHDTEMTWLDADAACRQHGGKLAESYPVVSEELKRLVLPAVYDNNYDYNNLQQDELESNREVPIPIERLPFRYNPQPASLLTDTHIKTYWIGKSVSPWVIFRGCVNWKTDPDKYKAYGQSKYNQMSECATACTRSQSFLLQGGSCYCISDKKTTGLSPVNYTVCSSQCPGHSTERCGGRHGHTLYDYYVGDIVETGDTNHCVARVNDVYKSVSCDEQMGFTCKMANGSKITINPHIPGMEHLVHLNWQKAMDFCGDLPGGLGMSAMPSYPDTYLSELYWTTIMRTVDWYYDAEAQRRPRLSYVSTAYTSDYYMEESIRNRTEKHSFLCQNDFVSCGYESIGTMGNITSPNYPLQYGHAIVCKWDIAVNESKVIRLEIVDVDIETSPSCIYDYLSIQERGVKTHRLCGHKASKIHIFTTNNTVSLMFRSDDTNVGMGFHITWTAVDPTSKQKHATDSSENADENKDRLLSVNGAAIAGVTVVVTAFLVVLLTLVACVIYRKRHAHDVASLEETSTAHNAIYAISSFNTSSVIASENRTYENISQTRRQTRLQAEVSYANNPGKINENSQNVYQSMHDRNNDATVEHYVDAGSKANLLLDSDSSTFGSIDSGRNRQGTKYQSADASAMEQGGPGDGAACTLDISYIEDIGKDCITVISVDSATGNDHDNRSVTYDARKVHSVEYAEIILAEAVGLDNEEGYLNEDLDCNAIMPETHDYMEMPSTGPGIDNNATIPGMHMDMANTSPGINNYVDLAELDDTEHTCHDNQQYDELDERYMGFHEENAESNVYTEL